MKVQIQMKETVTQEWTFGTILKPGAAVRIKRYAGDEWFEFSAIVLEANEVHFSYSFMDGEGSQDIGYIFAKDLSRPGSSLIILHPGGNKRE